MVDRRRWRSRVARCAARCSAQADCRSSPRLGVTPGHECSRAVLDLPKLSHENLSGSTRGRRASTGYVVVPHRRSRVPFAPACELGRLGAADKSLAALRSVTGRKLRCWAVAKDRTSSFSSKVEPAVSL